jgi:serine/threonine protein kinase
MRAEAASVAQGKEVSPWRSVFETASFAGPMGQSMLYEAGQIVPGTKLRILRPLGSGGMGSVYEVEETSVEKPYVLKVIHPHLLHGSGSRMQARMQQEAKTLARLEHKNIVQVYWAGVTDEVLPLPYYVMERLSGYTLRHMMRWHRSKGLPVPLSWAFRIASSLLSALGYAHENGIVHRDVKPDNIFLHQTRDGKPVIKLLDFGIMAVVSELSDQKRLTAGGFTGTYTHAAPEQLQGEKPTAAMDIYAAGVVLYEILAGRHPFEDRKVPTALMAAHLHESPRPIGSKRAVHPRLEELVLCMLAKDPAKRPQQAREIVNTLQRIRTEWISESSDTFAHDPADFQFDVDMGQPCLTNVGDEDSSLEASSESGAPDPQDDAPPRAGSGNRAVGRPSLRAPSSLARVPPLELRSEPDAPQGTVPTRGTWGQTLDEPSRRPRRTLLRIAAASAAWAVLAGGGAWLYLHRDAHREGTADAHDAASAFSSVVASASGQEPASGPSPSVSSAPAVGASATALPLAPAEAPKAESLTIAPKSTTPKPRSPAATFPTSKRPANKATSPPKNESDLLAP